MLGMWPHRLAAFALVFSLVSCGGGGGSAPSDLSSHVVVSWKWLPPEWSAWTTTGETPTTIDVSNTFEAPGLDSGILYAILVHELVHAAGYDGHLEPPCFLAPDFDLPHRHDPCAEEVAIMDAIDGTFEVECEDEALRDAALEATASWNKWVGWEMFVVE